MPQLLWILAAIAAGFVAGRYTAPADGDATPGGGGGLQPPQTKRRPLPPIPPIDEGDDPSLEAGPMTPAQAQALFAWESLPFNVEVYPSSGDRSTFLPPKTPAGLTIGPACTAVAVADGWWDRAGAMVDGMLDVGYSDPYAMADEILSAEVPECVEAQTLAHSTLRTEIANRILAAGVIRNRGSQRTVLVHRNGIAYGESGPGYGPGYRGVSRPVATRTWLHDLLWGRRGRRAR